MPHKRVVSSAHPPWPDPAGASREAGAHSRTGGTVDAVNEPEPPYAPSPVPSDARLWPGELPFTAFGQWGKDKLDLRVFDQDTWWVDVHGTAHRIDEMSYAYQCNVVMFLREHAEQWHQATMLRAALQAAGDTLAGLDPLEDLNPGTIAQMSPLQWLEQTPLMRKLRKEAGAGPPVR